MNEELPNDLVPVTPAEIARTLTPAKANRLRRIRNKVLASKRLARNKKIAKARKTASMLRRAGEPTSAALAAALRHVHNPIPCRLKGKVKQAGRSLDRLLNCALRAKKFNDDKKETI